MNCKKTSMGRLVLGVMAGAVAIAPLAHAQDTTTSSTTSSSSMMSSTPTQVTGSVLRYYVDRSGYVTAADIQTSNGVSMVHFPPGMAQRLYSTYPVGSNASVFVTGSPMAGGDTHWSVVGVGDTMPTNMMQPYMTSDSELLMADPYIVAGQKMVQFTGTLRRTVRSDSGEVLALVLSDVKNWGENGDTPVDGNVLVRVPREVRHVNTSMGASQRVTPLFRGAKVEVVGYPEAPRYGVVSRYSQWVAGSALVVDGHEVGAIGIPMMPRRKNDTLLDWDFMGDKTSDEERRAGMRGYRTYDPAMDTMSSSQ